MLQKLQESYGKQTVLVGPWGGQEGQHWDDGVYSTIRQVEIAHGAVIDSIKFEYDVNGRSIWSEIHGGSGGAKIDKVRLEYPDEFLTGVHGYYGSLHEHGPVFVRSLTLESNKRSYGPLGMEQGTHFAFPKTQGRIIGFLGKSGWFLDAIGAYIEPIQNHFSPNPVYYSQQYASNSTDKYGYSMIQGSLGNNYDLIVAVRQKDDHRTTPINLSPQISHDYTYTQSSKTNQHANINPRIVEDKIERVASENSDVHHQSKINQHANIPKSVENKIERVASKNISGVVTSGPWGGGGGSTFDDGVYGGVRQINLSRSVYIVAIRVCYEQNGQLVWGSKNGGTGAFKTDKIPFDYPSEILTHVTGYVGAAMMMGPSVIRSLTFHTTKGKYGPYGEEEGEFFSTKLKEGSMIVGFHGRKGLFLDAIGVHVLEGKVSPSSTSHNKTTAALPNSASKKPSNQTALVPYRADSSSEWPFKIGKRDDQAVHRMVKDPAPYGTGPWGGEGGKPWDDGVFTGIKQIIITITDAICCIEIEYDRNGQSVWSVKHGGTGGQTANRVKLEYPNEVVTCISGYYGPTSSGSRVMKSVTFHSSRRKYGPFGEEKGTYFASGTTEGKVVGFHGRSSMYLDAIGVHMQHWLGNNKRSSPYKAASSLIKIFS